MHLKKKDKKYFHKKGLVVLMQSRSMQLMLYIKSLLDNTLLLVLTLNLCSSVKMSLSIQINMYT